MQKKHDTTLSTNHASAAHQGQSAQSSTTAQSAAGIANGVPTHTLSSSSGASAVSKGRFSLNGKTLLKVQNSDLTNGCFDIPAGVTSIGRGAFANCSGLIQVTIPSGVTSIGAGASDSSCWRDEYR